MLCDSKTDNKCHSRQHAQNTEEEQVSKKLCLISDVMLRKLILLTSNDMNCGKLTTDTDWFQHDMPSLMRPFCERVRVID